MKTRRLGPFDVAEIGLGCMNVSHAYGPGPSPEDARALIRRAFDLGVTHFDTAAIYGHGDNEVLVGEALGAHRHEIVLASKCGMSGPNRTRAIDSSPARIKRTCEESLRRLNTDVIDLYYLHRWDKKTPIADCVGALADLVREGKVKTIGLSEVSAATLRKAHAVHPIAAVQSEYSLWTRNAEVAVLDACAELGVTYVAFSPVARGFLAGGVADPPVFADGDIRRTMPRFQEPNYAANLRLLDSFGACAARLGCTRAQLAIAWLLHKADHIVPIPGTTSVAHLEEDLGAADVALSPAAMAELEAMINARTVSGGRYSATLQPEIDTEELPAG
ncbi:MAG: aldo/keto reductase [Alphaproteobacteria bacterium]